MDHQLSAGSKDNHGQSDIRKGRLAEQLRANLARRKAQARARRAGLADERPDGLDATQGGGEADAETVDGPSDA